MEIRRAIPRDIPALCPKCGIIFNTHSGYFEYPVDDINGILYEHVSENPTTRVISLNGTAGCPVCNYEKAEFRCDLFEYVRKTFKELKELGLPEMVYLEKLIKKLSENLTEENFKKTKEEAESKIKGLTIFQRINDSRLAVIFAFIQIILVTIQIIQNSVETKQPITIENVYQVTLKQEAKEVNIDSIKNEVKKNTPPQKKKIGRNELCPCGSGKKFKKCCINKKQSLF